MVLDERKHKSTMSVGSGGGGKYGKEVIIDVSANDLETMTGKEGMDTLLMELQMMGMTCSGVVGPYRL